MFWGGLTNAGHPLACAAAIASLEVYREEGLVENSREMGRRLLDHLRQLEERHLSVGEVRGLGLFAAIELVKDKETREMLVPWAGQDTRGVVATLKRALLERGLYTILRWNIIFVAPPLSITEPELQEGLEIIDEVLKIADDTV
jgi:taurine--2-oxoglutarate transaminase